MTENCPNSVTRMSFIVVSTAPFTALTLPRSPTCLHRTCISLLLHAYSFLYTLCGNKDSNSISVREYVFFVFFQISKKRDFLRFFEMTLKKTLKVGSKNFVLNDVTKKEKSLLNVYRNFGVKTPGCYGYL